MATARATFRYRAYGLNLGSDLELFGLAPSRATPDVHIRIGEVPRVPMDPMASGAGHRRILPGEAVLSYDGVGLLAVRDGREIVVEPVPGEDAATLAPYVVGPALGVLLLQRGVLTLHGSAVAVGGSACVFVGAAGAGKSTAAGSLARRGHRLLADDISPLVRTADGHAVQPGYPAMKLTAESASALGHSFDTMRPLSGRLRKRTQAVAGRFDHELVPVQRVYVLDDGDDVEVAPLGGVAALEELVRHTYGVGILATAGLAEVHLRQCAEVATRVSVRRLTRPRVLARLDDVSAAVEADMAAT